MSTITEPMSANLKDMTFDLEIRGQTGHEAFISTSLKDHRNVCLLSTSLLNTGFRKI